MEIMCHLTVLQIEGDDVIALSVLNVTSVQSSAGLNSIPSVRTRRGRIRVTENIELSSDLILSKVQSATVDAFHN